MEKTYNPKTFEERINKRWLDGKCFTPDKSSPNKSGDQKVLDSVAAAQYNGAIAHGARDERNDSRCDSAL